VFGRTSGSVAGYHYSAALGNAKLVWDDKTLDQYLQNPNGFVHGTKMFASIPDAQIREQLITYLKTLQAASRWQLMASFVQFLTTKGLGNAQSSCERCSTHR